MGCCGKVVSTLGHIVEAIVVPQDDEVVSSRKSICEQCSEYKTLSDIFSICNNCKCCLQLKWRSTDKCPLDKWT